MIKFIATDMDGTLLNTQAEVHGDFPEVLEKIKANNILFAIASGRQYYNLLDKFEEMKDHILFIAENGTYVVYKGEEILVNAVERELANELIRIGRTIKNADIVLCGKQAAYIEKADERLIKEVEKYYAKYKIVENLELVEDEILKVTLCDFAGSEQNSLVYYKAYSDKVQVTVSGQIWLDMVAKGVNKGVAIKHIQELFNITHEECMVFGDYLNDLEMMDSAYHSYAMANAHEELKKRARFVTKSNDENGVLETICSYLGQMK